jgi:hypothetical protein
VEAVEDRRAGQESAARDPSMTAARPEPGVGAARMTRPVEAVDAAARIETIDALREQVSAQPLRRVSLRVGEGADAARVRVDLRGDRVQAEMATDSERLATRLRHEIPELGRTLERHGIEVDGLKVRHGERVMADPFLARPVEAPRPGDGTSSSRDPEAGARRHHEQGREQPHEDDNQEESQ